MPIFGKKHSSEEDGKVENSPDLFADLKRGDPDRELERQHPSSDHFMRLDDVIADPTLQYDGDAGDRVFLGTIGPHLVGAKDDRHIFTVAGSRGGKSTAAIVPNLLQYRGSVLAIDPKGELATRTARRRAFGVPGENGSIERQGIEQSVYVIDPFQKAVINDPAPAVIRSARFNPLQFLGAQSPTIVEDAALIADALVVPSGEDPHWDESARTLLECLILHVATWPGILPTHRNLVTVRRLLLSLGASQAQEDRKGRSESFDIRHLEQNKALDGLINRLAHDFLDRPEKEAGSVLSTARRHTKFLDLPNIEYIVTPARSSFSLDELKQSSRGVTIYLCLPPSMLNLCRGWLRMFVNLTLASIERTTVGGKGEIANTGTGLPVLLCLDEFAALGYLTQIEAAAAYIAGYGALLWVILQDLPQIQRHYKDSWETFIGNAGILQFFSTMDLTTQRYVSERLGTARVASRSYEYSQTGERNKRAAPSTSLSGDDHPLLTPTEVGVLTRRNDPDRRQIIFLQEQKFPLLLQKAEYFRSTPTPFFLKKYDRLPSDGDGS